MKDDGDSEKKEKKTTRNVSGASDFQPSSSSTSAVTIESRNVINCLFITTTQEILLCFLLFFSACYQRKPQAKREQSAHTSQKALAM